MNRLSLIEGLRAWLALWVLAGHVLAASGYGSDLLTWMAWLVSQNLYAVDLFIMVSGFVIFSLLDRREESGIQFICRRFFRLYPVFIILFAVAIPVSLLKSWNLEHAQQYLSPGLTEYFTREINAEWLYLRWNIFWHLPLLHGLVPDPGLTKSTALAFLGSAWSISLEWQFYLVAPLAYLCATSPRPQNRIYVCAACVYVMLAADWLPHNWYNRAGIEPHGWFLPFHVDFFFIGAVCYFIYKQIKFQQWRDITFPVATSMAMILWLLGAGNWHLIPVCFWIIFFGLLCESPTSVTARFVRPFFTNRAILFLGRISYSLYLSHELVVTVLQFILLKYAPSLPKPMHFWLLLMTTLVATIGISALLYRYVEAPGVQLGRHLASKIQKNPAASILR